MGDKKVPITNTSTLYFTLAEIFFLRIIFVKDIAIQSHYLVRKDVEIFTVQSMYVHCAVQLINHMLNRKYSSMLIGDSMSFSIAHYEKFHSMFNFIIYSMIKESFYRNNAVF
jgi:hypothetical protein